MNIDLMVGVWPTGCAGSTPARLRALAAKTWTVEDAKIVKRLAAIVEAWCDDIATLLSPEHGKHISAACPHCGAESVLHRDSAGEMVRWPALHLVQDSERTYLGAECRACEAFWEREQLAFLAEVLGCPKPEGVL